MKLFLNQMEMTPMQERLIKKLGGNAFPLTFQFPQQSPSSVTLQAGEDDQGKPLGVEYYIKCYVGENEDDKSHKRSSVSLTIKKLQYAPPTRGEICSLEIKRLILMRKYLNRSPFAFIIGQQGLHFLARQNQLGNDFGP